MDERISKVINGLAKNNIKAIYAKTSKEACDIVKDLLFDGCTITIGGSESVKESGVFDILNSGKYRFLDRGNPNFNEAERQNTYKETVGGDFYFCSTNAVTENGELINVDGNSNRISAIAFGPKTVVMIVGTNKIVKDVNEGFLRVKTTAAPLNCVRLKLDNPCVKLNKCVSLVNNENPCFTDGCASKTRICRNYLVSAAQKEKDRIIVVLVDEKLGY